MTREQLSERKEAIAFVDATPSELIHNSSDKYICIVLVHYLQIKRNQIDKLPQFKDSRTLDRRIKIQKKIIDYIKKEIISPIGILNFNYKNIALQNGKVILKKFTKNENYDFLDKITIGNEEMKYGQSLSLAWYSIVLSKFLMEMGRIAKAENKNNVAILLDLLPGDNINSFRNMNTIKFLINNTELEEFQNLAIQENNLEKIGYGYGVKNESTREIKNSLDYVLTDWIVQSFYSLLKYEKENLDIYSSEFKLSELARYLINKKTFTIQKAYKLG